MRSPATMTRRRCVAPRRHNATHMAIGTHLSEAEIAEICDRYGLPAKYRKRGDVFGVIEIFVEGCQMLEVLTYSMQREYISADHHRQLDGDDRGAAACRQAA